MDATAIHVELSETAIARDMQKASQLIRELTVTGLNVTLDDFGTGRSTLTELASLPIYAIKLDRSFTRDIGQVSVSENMLRSIISMAHELGWVPTAKGIETDEQVDFLIESDCIIGQGYYFSDPLEEGSARNYMIKHSF